MGVECSVGRGHPRIQVSELYLELDQDCMDQCMRKCGILNSGTCNPARKRSQILTKSRSDPTASCNAKKN